MKRYNLCDFRFILYGRKKITVVSLFLSRESNFENGMPIWNTSEPVATNMAVSTLFLHDLQHRRNQQPSRRNCPGPIMPDIRETPDEDDYANPSAVATAALAAAVHNLSNNSRLAKST